MKIMDFQKLEAFEEQVHRARELFVASVHNPYRPEMMAILQAAEKALKTAQKSLGLDDGRSEPQSGGSSGKPANAATRARRNLHRYDRCRFPDHCLSALRDVQ